MTLIRVFGRALEGPKWLGRATKIATGTVAEHLVRLVSVDLAQDISRVKESMLQQYGAEADGASAEARRRTAEAIEAENQAALSRRTDVLAMVEKRRRVAETRKAEADATRAEAEADLMVAAATVAKAHANAIVNSHDADEVAKKAADLKAAVRRLNQRGGGLFIDTPALKRLLEAGSKSEHEAGE